VDRDRAGDALDEADDLDGLAADRHAVDDPHDAVIGVERRLQHERVVPVLPLDALDPSCRRDAPTPVVLVAEQRSEGGR
jgi:hypothetical protein